MNAKILEQQIAQRKAAAAKNRNQAAILAKQSEISSQKAEIETAKMEILYAKADLETADKTDKIHHLEVQSSLKQLEAALLYYRAKLLKLQEALKALKPVKPKAAVVIDEEQDEEQDADNADPIFEVAFQKLIDLNTPQEIIEIEYDDYDYYEDDDPIFDIAFQHQIDKAKSTVNAAEEFKLVPDEEVDITSKTAAELEDCIGAYITMPENTPYEESAEFHKEFDNCILGHFFLNKWQPDAKLLDQAAIDLTNASDYFAIVTTSEIDNLHYLHGIRFSHDDGKISYIRKTYKTVKGVQNAGAKWLGE